MSLRWTLSGRRSRLSFGLSAIAVVAWFVVSLLATSYDYDGSASSGEAAREGIDGRAGDQLDHLTTRPLFSQTTASPTFRHGPFAGESIGDVAGGPRAGKISAADLPVDVIVRNGETIGLNTRSMLALRRGGIDPADWLLNDVTGVPGMERLLTERLLRNQSSHAATSDGQQLFGYDDRSNLAVAVARLDDSRSAHKRHDHRRDRACVQPRGAPGNPNSAASLRPEHPKPGQASLYR